jgi:transposase-like protein
MVDFKGSQFPKAVILYAVWFYVRFPVSYRDLEEIMAERGVEVDHATLNRWVEKFSGQIASEAQKRKAQPARSWRMDETYIKVKGRWCYLYRAVGECHELCVSGLAHAGFRYGHALKRSSNIMAKWLRAANHSRTFWPRFSNLWIAR